MAGQHRTDPARGASPLFLRETEVRRGIELLQFGQAQLARTIDELLSEQGLGHAHQRVLYFIARKPDLSVGDLLSLLGITKQSLGRVLNELTERGYVQSREGDRDRRQRLLRLTPEGAAFEAQLFERLRARLSTAYQSAGQDAVGGFWTVLEELIPPGDRALVEALREPPPRVIGSFQKSAD